MTDDMSFFSAPVSILPRTGSGYTPDLFRRDPLTGTTVLLTMNYEWTGESVDWRGDPISHSVSGISGDGRVVAFSSTATDLNREDGNRLPDVFVWREYPPGPTADLRMTSKELSHATNLVVISVSVTNFGLDKATQVRITIHFRPASNH